MKECSIGNHQVCPVGNIVTDYSRIFFFNKFTSVLYILFIYRIILIARIFSRINIAVYISQRHNYGIQVIGMCIYSKFPVDIPQQYYTTCKT